MTAVNMLTQGVTTEILHRDGSGPTLASCAVLDREKRRRVFEPSRTTFGYLATTDFYACSRARGATIRFPF